MLVAPAENSDAELKNLLIVDILDLYRGYHRGSLPFEPSLHLF